MYSVAFMEFSDAKEVLKQGYLRNGFSLIKELENRLLMKYQDKSYAIMEEDIA